jgi:hypothetical protein
MSDSKYNSVKGLPALASDVVLVVLLLLLSCIRSSLDYSSFNVSSFTRSLVDFGSSRV